MNETGTPSYIKSLLMPNGRKPAGRRVWSIDLETIWLPFFLATNTMGDTAIPAEALGSPIRLAYNQDGSVKFSKTGRPVTKVVKDLGDTIRLVRENFTANLASYANSVQSANPEGYKAQIDTAKIAGEPIVARDRANLSEAVAKAVEQAVAEAQAKKPEAKPEAKAKKVLVPA
jgi:hypothetical protein